MEIVLVEYGHLEWAVENIPEALNPGTVFFTLPWQAHGSLLLREPRNRIFYTLFSLRKPYRDAAPEIRFSPAFGFSAEEERMLSQVLVNAPHHAWPASKLLLRIFPELIQRLDGTSPLDHAAARSLLRAVLFELVTIISNAPEVQQTASPTARSVQAFLKSISQQLEERWTLEAMASACGIKRTQFAKITQQITGYPPLQYLSRVRFEKACELLRNLDRDITGIAFECGYSSSQYFAETFKKYAQMTPSEYRASLARIEDSMQAGWAHPEWRSIADEQKRASELNR